MQCSVRASVPQVSARLSGWSCDTDHWYTCTMGMWCTTSRSWLLRTFCCFTTWGAASSPMPSGCLLAALLPSPCHLSTPLLDAGAGCTVLCPGCCMPTAGSSRAGCSAAPASSRLWTCAHGGLTSRFRQPLTRQASPGALSRQVWLSESRDRAGRSGGVQGRAEGHPDKCTRARWVSRFRRP